MHLIEGLLPEPIHFREFVSAKLQELMMQRGLITFEQASYFQADLHYKDLRN